MKGHICVKLVEHTLEEQSLKVRVTSFGQRFSQLSVLKKACCNLAHDCGFLRLRKILNCGNCGVYYIPSSRRQKRRFRLRSFFRSEGNRSHALFHDCHHEDECISQNGLELALAYLSHVLCVLLVESVVMYETPPLFYGILPWFECVLAAVIPVILVSFQSSYRWFLVQTQGTSFNP